MIPKLLAYCKQHQIFKESTICGLHKPCIAIRQCTPCSTQSVIDYDSFKEWYCAKYKSRTVSSVDALILDPKAICLIEIKGWDEFLKHQSKCLEKAVNKQLNKYDFESKYSDSLRLLINLTDSTCFEFSSDERSAFHATPKYYLLVTDIDYREKGVEYLNESLGFLAESSSTKNREDHCLDKTKEHFDRLKSVDMLAKYGVANPINQHIIYCRDFDQEISQLLQ